MIIPIPDYISEMQVELKELQSIEKPSVHDQVQIIRLRIRIHRAKNYRSSLKPAPLNLRELD